MLSFLPCCLVCFSSLKDLLTPRPCNSCVPINELFEVKYEKLFLLPLFKKVSNRPLSVLELMTIAAPTCSWEILNMTMLNVYYIKQS